jgi:hypothetical protein
MSKLYILVDTTVNDDIKIYRNREDTDLAFRKIFSEMFLEDGVEESEIYDDHWKQIEDNDIECEYGGCFEIESDKDCLWILRTTGSHEGQQYSWDKFLTFHETEEDLLDRISCHMDCEHNRDDECEACIESSCTARVQQKLLNTGESWVNELSFELKQIMVQ